MGDGSFAALSRRASLLTLGGAALAASVTNAGVSEAKKKGKDCKKKEKQRCSNDAAACINTFLAVCELTPPECAALQACCDECSSDGVLTCLLAASASAVAKFP
jgi:hypothetical protein